MGKFFDFLVRWSEDIYEERYESMSKTYNFSIYMQNKNISVDPAKSSNSIKKLETAQAHNN